MDARTRLSSKRVRFIQLETRMKAVMDDPEVAGSYCDLFYKWAGSAGIGETIGILATGCIFGLVTAKTSETAPHCCS